MTRQSRLAREGGKRRAAHRELAWEVGTEKNQSRKSRKSVLI